MTGLIFDITEPSNAWEFKKITETSLKTAEGFWKWMERTFGNNDLSSFTAVAQWNPEQIYRNLFIMLFFLIDSHSIVPRTNSLPNGVMRYETRTTSSHLMNTTSVSCLLCWLLLRPSPQSPREALWRVALGCLKLKHPLLAGIVRLYWSDTICFAEQEGVLRQGRPKIRELECKLTGMVSFGNYGKV